MVEFLTSQLGVSIVLGLLVVVSLLGITTYCIYFERKIAAWIQDRPGPNRVGPWGLLQLAADGGKFVFKEDIVSRHVDKALFILAPGISMLVGFITFAVIPWGGQWRLGDGLVNVQVAALDIGLLYILGVGALGVYGVVLAGWTSNNKYSLFGAVRATAQMLSYEIPMGICILIIVLTMGTLRLEDITVAQTGLWFGFIPQWNVFLHPIAFVVLFVTVLAETNRTPFDLAEAEQELVCGFHTEYNALKFGMFFLAEYAHMITSSAVVAVLFLGGWHMPGIPWAQPEATSLLAVLVKVSVLGTKIAGFIFLMMWIRWTLPRFRFDRLMGLAWKWMIPWMLVLLVMTAALLYFGLHRTGWVLIGNGVVLALMLVAGAVSKEDVNGRATNLPPAPSCGPSPQFLEAGATI